MNWNLNYFFKSNEEFELLFNDTKNRIATFKLYENKLDDFNNFKSYLNEQKMFFVDIYRLYQYASLKSDLNKKNVENDLMINKVRMLLFSFEKITSFEMPEILRIGKDKIMEFISKDESLSEYKFIYEKVFHNASHILDQKSEQLLTCFSPLQQNCGELYSNLAVGDNTPVKVTLSNKEVVVTQGNYQSLIADAKNENDRKLIFEAIFNNYEKLKCTFAGIYQSVLLSDKATAQARGYKNCLEAHLDGNKIPCEVYYNLIDIAGNYNSSLKHYLELRKNYLNLSEIHTYDRFIELATTSKKYSYEEAKKLFFSSIASCPDDFIQKAEEVLASGFVDVYEQDGKRTGAYSSSVPNMHPFILLNYDDTLDSVFTVAHEAGHSIHSMYASEAQPFMLQDYTIFVAEIASTFNEHMLLDYFLKLDNVSKDEKIIVLQKAIDNIIGTFYRQALFAEYELKAHQLVENNQPISHETLSSIMVDLYKKYYNIDIEKEKVKKYVWAYIPHLFYTPFYVYQYATSFAASFQLYKAVSNNEPYAMEKYINLLKSGGSKYPMEQTKDAGVDFTNKNTFMAVVNRMDELVNLLEQLLSK